jgi:hypothetical protein
VDWPGAGLPALTSSTSMHSCAELPAGSGLGQPRKMEMWACRGAAEPLMLASASCLLRSVSTGRYGEELLLLLLPASHLTHAEREPSEGGCSCSGLLAGWVSTTVGASLQLPSSALSAPAAAMGGMQWSCW